MIVLGMIIYCLVMGIAMLFCFAKAEEDYDYWWLNLVALICLICLFAIPIGFGMLHGYTNYYPSNDKDLARITAITMDQSNGTPHYRIEVEYLTNANGLIDTDTYYCYIEDDGLVRKVQNHLYEEVWIISGYKGGYETYKDFGDHLLKDIQTKEEVEK